MYVLGTYEEMATVILEGDSSTKQVTAIFDCFDKESYLLDWLRLASRYWDTEWTITHVYINDEEIKLSADGYCTLLRLVKLSEGDRRNEVRRYLQVFDIFNSINL
jgi:hypothetical protein